MQLYFVRHGESEANILQVISNRGWKHGLTGLGRRQADALAERLQPFRPRHIFSSPLMRAVQTAEILSEALGIAYTRADALREYDCGIAEDRTDLQAWELYDIARDEWFKTGHWDYRIPAGESLMDMRCRFEPFIDQLLSTTREDSFHGPAGVAEDGAEIPGFTIQDRLILISHGGLLHSCLPFVLANITYEQARELPLSNTDWVMAEARPEGLVCLEWSGVKFSPDKS